MRLRKAVYGKVPSSNFCAIADTNMRGINHHRNVIGALYQTGFYRNKMVKLYQRSQSLSIKISIIFLYIIKTEG